MDWISALWAGALGAVGGLLGGVVSRVFPEKARGAVTIITIVGAVALSRAISPEDAGRMTDQQWLVDLALAHDRAKLEAAFDELPDAQGQMLRLIREGQPELYADIRDNTVRLARDGATEEEVANDTRRLIADWMTERTPRLSDSEIAEVMQLTRDQLALLEPDLATVCADTMYGRELGLLEEAFMLEGFVELDMEMYAIAFESDLEGGETLPAEETNAILEAVVAEVIEAHPESAMPTFAVYNDPSLEPPAEACAVFITYLDRIIARPMPERAQLWRTLLLMEQA